MHHDEQLWMHLIKHHGILFYILVSWYIMYHVWCIICYCIHYFAVNRFILFYFIYHHCIGLIKNLQLVLVLAHDHHLIIHQVSYFINYFSYIHHVRSFIHWFIHSIIHSYWCILTHGHHWIIHQVINCCFINYSSSIHHVHPFIHYDLYRLTMMIDSDL